MGYSPQKKQLDLKEFLSTPAKKRPYKSKFDMMRKQTETAAPTAKLKPDETAS